MRVKVTQEDIEKGIPEHCGKCPIARAIRRAMPDAISVGVGSIGVEWFDKSGFRVAELPQQAQQFIYYFDFGEPVQPFEFDLEIPQGG